MPRTPGIPSYRRKGRYAIVTLPTEDGRRDVMLGKYGTEASRHAYTRVLQEWQAGGNVRANRKIVVGLTVGELAFEYHRAAGRTMKGGNYKSLGYAIRVLNRHAETLPVSKVGPNLLREVRESMIRGNPDLDPPRKPWSRLYAQQQTRALIAMFRWAVSRELIPSSVYESLRTIEPLLAGKSDARETDPVAPAPKADIEAVRAIANKRIQAMIDVQLATGMRPGELCKMRLADLDMSGSIWLYQPKHHKTAYQGRSRIVMLGPRCQRAMMPFMDKPKTKPIFGYGAGGYYVTIRRLCVKAGVPHWHPNQLRHNAATTIRAEFGLEAAAVWLGHSSAVLTDAVYAQRDTAALRRMAAAIG